MTPKQLGILNALVTFAAENIPGGLSDDEREVAQIVGAAALIGNEFNERREEFESWKRCLLIERAAGTLTLEEFQRDLARYERIFGI